MTVENRLATIDDGILQCPRCRDDGETGNLHSTGVIVYDREERLEIDGLIG
jgi:hypothetical protein